MIKDAMDLKEGKLNYKGEFRGRKEKKEIM